MTTARDEVAKLLLTDRDGGWPRPLTHGRHVAFVHRPLADLNRLELRIANLVEGTVYNLTGCR